jgi:prevent-host-death family protein
MESIGVRELRQNASRWLARVARGESFEVTDRGRRVALLVPPPRESGLAGLLASGRARAGGGNLHDLPRPAQRPPGALTATQALEQLRAEER